MKLSDYIVFFRNSIGTYYDINGDLVEAPSDEPRIEYDPLTGEELGFLIEEGVTNLLTYNRDYRKWGMVTAGDVLIEKNQIGIDGIPGTACKLTSLNPDVNNRVRTTVSIPANTDTYIASVFIHKNSTSGIFRFRLSFDGYAVSNMTSFNLSTVTPGPGIEDYGDW